MIISGNSVSIKTRESETTYNIWSKWYLLPITRLLFEYRYRQAKKKLIQSASSSEETTLFYTLHDYVDVRKLTGFPDCLSSKGNAYRVSMPITASLGAYQLDTVNDLNSFHPILIMDKNFVCFSIVHAGGELFSASCKNIKSKRKLLKFIHNIANFLSEVPNLQLQDSNLYEHLSKMGDEERKAYQETFSSMVQTILNSKYDLILGDCDEIQYKIIIEAIEEKAQLTPRKTYVFYNAFMDGLQEASKGFSEIKSKEAA